MFCLPHLDLFATCANAKFPLCVSSSGPVGLVAGRFPTPLGPSVSLSLPTICSAQVGIVKSSSFDRALIVSGDAVVATAGVVRQPFVPVGQ